MRRSLPLLLLALFALSLPACGGDDSGGNQPVNDTSGGGKDATVDWAGGQDTTKPDVDVGPDSSEPCQSTCEQEWARECLGSGWRVCEDADDDGCFDWSEPTPCEQGSICQGGACIVSCEGQACTVVGARKCQDGATVLTCGDLDDDGCLEWGSAEPCDAGLVCSGGFCATSCTNECTIAGAKKCEGDAVLTCGDVNVDGCLEWGAPAPCDAGLVCSGGHCSSSCSDECTIEGSRKCDGNGYVVCGDANHDGCLEWGTPAACAPPQSCANGFCVDTCEAECSAVGARKCDGNGVATCGDTDENGCLEWGSPVPCEDGLVCSSGHCAATCEDECTVVGAKTCNAGGSLILCGDYDDDPCLEWGSPTPCAQGLVCSEGNCLMDCQDECAGVNVKECVAGTTAQFHLCDDHDGDGCLEWGDSLDCDAGLICQAGSCATSCEDECQAVGQKQCDGDAVEICNDHDQDGCLEWGTPVFCEVFEACQNGNCIQQQATATIVINELRYDGAGIDADSFVELAGPAGTDLTGFSLVGIDGDGQPYKTIDLSGVVGPQGLFLLVQDTAPEALLAKASQVSLNADLQNGPDSVQLRYGSSTEDAVGYGDFSGGAVFAGEGDPALDVGTGHSLGRDDQSGDSDDNAVDFHDFAVPTPGEANVIQSAAPVAVLACPETADVNEEVSIDGSGSSDPDGQVASYLFKFGDGNEHGPSEAATVAHTYLAADAYTVTLTVTDDDGLSSSAVCDIQVVDPSQNLPPVAALDCPAGAAVGVPAPFSGDQSSDPDGSIVTYDYDFGDGEASSSAEAETTHTYAAAGPVTVTLTVTDDGGATGQATCELTVSETDPCEGVTCDEPPATTCADDSTVRSFAAQGTCDAGACTYEPTDTPCDQPPATACQDGQTLLTYPALGACGLGACDYPATPTDCPHGCADAACQPGPTYVVGWCLLQWPHTVERPAGEVEPAYARLFVDGVTNQSTGGDANAAVVMEIGYGPDGSDPAAGGWQWSASAVNPTCDGCADANDEYMGDLTVGAVEGSPYDFAFRASGDGGQTWTHCDKNGTDDGYSADQAGHMVAQ